MWHLFLTQNRMRTVIARSYFSCSSISRSYSLNRAKERYLSPITMRIREILCIFYKELLLTDNLLTTTQSLRTKFLSCFKKRNLNGSMVAPNRKTGLKKWINWLVAARTIPWSHQMCKVSKALILRRLWPAPNSRWISAINLSKALSLKMPP